MACLPLKPHESTPVRIHMEEFRVESLVLSLGLAVPKPGTSSYGSWVGLFCYAMEKPL